MPIVSDPLGRVLGDRYQLVAPLGSGASAHVFLAEDMVLQRRVAVKVLLPALVHDEAFLRRFRAEARSVAALNHPHVLRVFDWGEDDDGPYLVLEYLEGGSLHDMLARGRRLSVSQAARTGAQAADGLAYAHARGIVHRDVKPANLLFDEDGRVRVADFGVARALAGSALTEPSGGMLGTARYASPEQAQGQPVDGRTDVYSLALVLYEAVTGTVPFARESPLATLQARIGAPLPVDDAYGELGPVLEWAGSPDPQKRPDASTFAERLRGLDEGMSPGGPLPLVRRALVEDGAPTLIGAARPGAAAGGGGGSDGHGPEMETGDADEVPAEADLTLANFPIVDGEELPDTGEPTATGMPYAGGRESYTPRRTRQVRRWPWVVAVLVLLACLVAAGGFYAVEQKVFVPTRRVPGLIGDTVAVARQALRTQHLAVRVGPAVKSTKYAKGHVIREIPRRGARVKQGSVVTIVASAGVPAVTVPSLAGEINCSVARQLLKEANLHARCPALSAYTKNVPRGDVINWSYNGKLDPTSAPWGSTILVAISEGKPPVSVPNLVRQSWTQANTTLSADGLHVKEALTYSTTVPANEVIKTTPPVGATVTNGSSILVTVSKGSQEVVVPTVIGDTVTAATAAINAANLSVGPVYGPATGVVFTTDPLQGQKAKVGTPIVLYTETVPKTGAPPPKKHSSKG